jgi:hypothetical protein
MLELLDAAQKAFEGDAELETQHSGTDTWVLAEAITVTRSGWENAVLAEFIGSHLRKRVTFAFDSAVEVLNAGDFFSVGTEEISIFHLSAMKPKKYKIRNLKDQPEEKDD